MTFKAAGAALRNPDPSGSKPIHTTALPRHNSIAAGRELKSVIATDRVRWSRKLGLGVEGVRKEN